MKRGSAGTAPRAPFRPATARRIATIALAGVVAVSVWFWAPWDRRPSDRSRGDAAEEERAVGTSGSDPDAEGLRIPAGNRRMHERLAAIADAADQVTDTTGAVPAFGTNRPALVPILRARLAGINDPTQGLVTAYEIATQLLLAGRSREALQNYESLQALLDSLPLPAVQKRAEAASLQGALGLAALRLGEQDNCLLNHRASSCLFPIDRDGVHTLRDGSSRAARAFAEQLTLDPGNLGARWLLNLAHMTLGTYPDGVPARWRIAPERLQSDAEFPRFADVANAAGVDVVGLAGGCVLEDLDGDGDLDVAVSSWGLRDPIRLFRNDGAAGFVERTDAAGLAGEWGGINLTHADVDNDGDEDIFVHRGGWLGEAGLIPNSLLRNDGGLHFTDVTDEAGLYSEHPTHAAAWGDFDNDGWLDLFVGNEDAGSGRHPVQLYRNQGNGTFVDVAPALGLGVLGVIKGVAWGDYDNDGWLDLYISRYGRPNLLFHNEPDAAGHRRFSDVAARAGVSEPALSFATWFFDYDNDGWLDLFVAGWSGAPVAVVAAEYLGRHTPEGTPRLFRNRHDGTFEDVSQRARVDRVHLAMGANFGDLDNDGWLDLYLGTGGPDLTSLVPNRMFRNDGHGHFQDVTTAGGFGHLQKGHGIAFADLDNDGDQDVYAVMGGWFTGDVYQNALFENPGTSGRWLSVKLEGVRSNRMGVGARLKIRVQTPSGPREIFRVVTDGGSFGSGSFRQAIGLGDATAIERLEVTWPASRLQQTFTDVPLDRFVHVREDDQALRVTSPASFRLAGSGGHRAAHAVAVAGKVP